MTKALYQQKLQKSKVTKHKNVTKDFDFTTIVGRLRTVSWSYNSYPTGLVKSVYGISTFPLTAKSSCAIKRTHIENKMATNFERLKRLVVHNELILYPPAFT